MLTISGKHHTLFLLRGSSKNCTPLFPKEGLWVERHHTLVVLRGEVQKLHLLSPKGKFPLVKEEVHTLYHLKKVEEGGARCGPSPSK